MYIPLTNHSAYSLQEGLLQPVELALAAKEAEVPAIGLTDHLLLTGSIEFVQACQKVGIQPLLGLEVNLESGPLVLMALSLAGWASLCSLSSTLALGPNPSGVCSLDLLSDNSKDLLAITGEQGDSTGRKIQPLIDIFPDGLYLSLQTPSQALRLSYLGRQLSLPQVVTHPVYYLTPEQAFLQHILTAIRLKSPLDRIPEGVSAPAGAHFIGINEMERRFHGSRAALAATLEISQRCTFDLPLGVSRMPVVPVPPGMTAAQVLRQKAEAGAVRLYGTLTPKIRTRLDHELEVISQMGFEPIFLIVEEILTFARQTNIPFSSRGSAASSLVAHCLGITSPDPLRLDLYFERFLNPARTIPPDIDTDLCSRRRDRLIQHVFDAYGNDRVAMVGTINRYRPRSALGDVAKAHGLAPAQVRELVGQLPYSYFARMQEMDEESGQPVSSYSDLRSRYISSSYQQIFNEAEALQKLPRHLSVHAGGLVITPGPLTELVPVMRSGSKGVTITQLDLASVEALGLVKIDLLGIRGLTVLGDVAEFILTSHPDRYKGALEVLESTPSDDTETSDRLETGGTIGCFQIESPGMRATLREIHARTQDDLMAALALYRPGPLSGGLKEAFVRRFKGEEPVQHLHPALSRLLGDTFGVILYQEQVLRIAHELAGFSLEEADLLRSAMSHFDPGKRMQELQRKFVDQSRIRSGIPTDIGERVWEMMAAFAGYGFPKAHAASYAQVGWRSAWCKTHFPAEFMAAVLANWGGYYNQSVYLGEARRLGLVIHPPHVNYSDRNFVVAHGVPGQKTLYMGLDQVRDLTGRTITRILQGRPFPSLEDFLARADPRPQEAVNLARIGAFEDFGHIPFILRRLQSGGWKAGQPNLFDWNNSNVAADPEDWTKWQKITAQKELLGTSLEAHPLELIEDLIASSGAISTIDAAGRIGQLVTVAGLRQSGHRSRTAKGEMMMFFTLEDLTGMLEIVAFPDVYHSAKSLIHSSEPFLVTGTIKLDEVRSEPLLIATKITPIK